MKIYHNTIEIDYQISALSNLEEFLKPVAKKNLLNNIYLDLNTNDSYFNHEGFFSIGENGQKQA